MKKIFISFLSFSILFLSNNGFSQSFVDQSGNTYKTVKIGSHIWMAENLTTDRYANGEKIEFETSVGWYVSKPSYTSLTNGQFLYSWEAIKDSRGIAPEGWHVPTSSEWKELISYCNNPDDLKSAIGWPTNTIGGYYENILCPNCKNWNSEYKRKVACQRCMDTRRIKGNYIPKKNVTNNGNNRLGFNIKNLGNLEKGEFNKSELFWTSELDTENCGSICGNAFIFSLFGNYISSLKHHEYMLPIRLVKD